jgi:hypothetical protein
LTGIDHLLYSTVNINHLNSQGSHQKAEGQNDHREHEQGHDQCGESLPFFQKVLKFFEDGIEGHRQEDCP